ncbi:ABC-F family ATP-binding cassette domain-containing protein [Limosilactobacillus vaginalis]|jgi:ATP-binding cassette subfamily F protein 3|uniref:ABC transporter, ATP-binding protein n=3 Tax=Limosilactobacillus vaginalis TaxID=1633 RepID=C2ETC7_9LACO|nr:ABC-F family ATP-binding cassette domain-containing protein [Limosilactobacillus vaginalis]PEH04494.1 ABC transporter ATP-binding protein [Lactobacillus sp. UMNPBX5]EEJ40910.1 ABC transporter, ATP-binding protein [Limosilactobacillus vaginalis DSM 5837 = ATCC 49540]KRM49189.1 ABC superfamily ATP binding cassette transporter, ABC protein [Limosilactobacillus vaginalis DSM 5837 = ATCC 49540]MCZ3667443.1 ABC-F family ATP-binding cassette domain-containing protein [Limosilactobacillus vaginalis]
MILLQANNVMRRFGADVLFHDINLQIQEHGRTALVGRNGAGKTTLLKMIAGITSPDEGTISKSKDLTIGYLAQDQGLDSQNSIWAELDLVFAPLHKMEKQIHQLENQLASLDPATKEFQLTTEKYSQLQSAFKKQGGFEYESRMRGILKGFGFEEADYQTAINSLSGGQKTKLALAKILLQSPDLLILDEPTNHLDMNVLAWLEDYLKSYQGALLVVSHDRYFLDRVVSDIYDLDNHTLRHYTGNYTQFMQHKQEWLTAEWKHYEQQQKKIAKLEDFVNRNIVRASTTKRAQARRKQLEKMDRMDRPETDDRSIHFHFHSDKDSGNEVLDVDRAVVGYNDQKLAGPLSFSVRKPQRVGIIGPNGIGKSTLLKSILDRIPLISGSIKLGANLQIGYYDQEQQQLHPEKSVLNEVWDDHSNVPEKDIRSLLGSFLFVGDDVYKLVHDLSGGEKARLELTKLSFKPINFLILDEPTNHLDIDSREVLENAINEFSGTVLFISHDRYFINQVATDVLDMSATGIKHYEGDYDDYLEAVNKELASTAGQDEQQVNSTAKPKKSSAQQSYQQSKETQRARRKLQRQVDKLEDQMASLEEQSQAIQEQMSQPEVATDIGQLADLQKQLNKLNEQSEEVELEWTNAAEELEKFDQENS